MSAIRERITPKQLAELTDAQKEQLREWWVPQVGDMVLTAKYSPNPPEAVLRLVTRTYGTHFYCDNLDMTKQDCLPLLNVGQCIELLQDKIAYFNMTNMFARIDDKQFGWGVMKPKAFDIRADELIDALWQAVKTLL